ncbi:sortase family protein [Mangrovibrevibacter kandeliae]|uniref:hypothetical protein n=1 Tax=Mangrovibrevibacter kandeliae TaxID=2968473 RepID=UPI0021182D27|nr:hypothetical protein [Aurantimonas sp. CSK15Z-1]MCQ8781705.1 hypothetical protein [Aurantimonas sp. CSK15Z-1]
MSGGYSHGEHEPTRPCPYCGTICRADFVDVGIGYTQCGPYHCDNCLASEIGPYDENRPLSEQEREAGWYAPGAEPGSTANVIGGRIVSHVQARDTYRREFAGNPLHDEPGHVEQWWAKQRERPA